MSWKNLVILIRRRFHRASMKNSILCGSVNLVQSDCESVLKYLMRSGEALANKYSIVYLCCRLKNVHSSEV